MLASERTDRIHTAFDDPRLVEGCLQPGAAPLSQSGQRATAHNADGAGIPGASDNVPSEPCNKLRKRRTELLPLPASHAGIVQFGVDVAGVHRDALKALCRPQETRIEIETCRQVETPLLKQSQSLAGDFPFTCSKPGTIFSIIAWTPDRFGVRPFPYSPTHT